MLGDAAGRLAGSHAGGLFQPHGDGIVAVDPIGVRQRAQRVQKTDIAGFQRKPYEGALQLDQEIGPLRKQHGLARAGGSADDDELTQLACVPELAKRSEEHTSELQSLMRISYAVFCLKKKNQ